MDRSAVLSAVAAAIPSHAMRGRRVHAGGIRGAMQAVVHWALQSSGDVRLQSLIGSPSPEIIVRALRAGGWSRQTDLIPLLDDIEAGGASLTAMFLDARMRAASHAQADGNE